MTLLKCGNCKFEHSIGVFRRSQVACVARTASNKMEMPSNQLRHGGSVTMKRREFNKNLAAATAVILLPFPRIRNAGAATTGGGATLVFNYANFPSVPSTFNVRNVQSSASALMVIDNGPAHTGGCVWYTTKQPPGPFTTQFSFIPQDLGSSSVLQSGMTFCIQNVVLLPVSLDLPALRILAMPTCAGTAPLMVVPTTNIPPMTLLQLSSMRATNRLGKTTQPAPSRPQPECITTEVPPYTPGVRLGYVHQLT